MTSQVAEEPALARAFAESLVAEAAKRATGRVEGGLVPSMDWEAIWLKADDGGSLERTVGRALVAVDDLVRGLEAGLPGTAAETVTDSAFPRANPPSGAVSWSPGLPLAVPSPISPVREEIGVYEAPTVVQAPESTGVLEAPTIVQDPEDGDVAVARRRFHLSTSRRRWYSFFTWLTNLGVVVMLFAIWQLWGTAILHSHSQETLRKQFRAHVRAVPKADTLLSASAQLPQPSEGSVVARLQIPAIGVDQFVVQGTAEADLSKGPGHYVGTALPGQQGNVAIAGHRTTYGAPFNRLDELKVGDSVTLTTSEGQRLVYDVSAAPVAVSPKDVGVLDDAGDNRVTLTTCNPKYSASQRLVIVAALQTPVASAATHPRRRERIVSSAVGWNLRYLPEVAALAVALIVLGLQHRRVSLHLRRARWVVLAPIWVAGIFFLFVGLSSLLPATL